MSMMPTARSLTECGFSVDVGYYQFLDEATKIQVTDAALTGMFKFITDKYNSIDFGEIEKSAGDYMKFKYKSLILDNEEILRNIYETSSDAGAAKYIEVLDAIRDISQYLILGQEKLSYLYKKGNGLVQVLYTSMVAGMLYALTALVTNTIRFVTSETDTSMEVLFDEIPGSIGQIHIRNILAVNNDLGTIREVIDKLYASARSGPNGINETVGEALAIATLVIGGIIYLIPKIMVLIREIIYSIYYARVRIADAIDVQVQLLRTNIESLEAGRGNKKVIARQKNVVNKLEALKTKIAVKMDAAESLSRIQQKKENISLNVDKNSEFSVSSGGSLML